MPTLSLKTRFIASAALALSLLLFTQTASAASFSVTPADPNLRLFDLEINPGEEATASVLVENANDEPVTVSVYGADGTQSNQGTFALTTRASEQKHIGLWVTTSAESVTVDARSGKEVSFKVKVPANATPGVYSGGIAVEENGGANRAAEGGTGISISARIVVKLFVTVPGEKVNKFEWTGFSYSPATENSPPLFTLSYKNSGNTVITADQKIVVTGFPGKEQSFSPTSAMLLQGSEVSIPVKWTDEPFAGFYTATASVKFSEYDITSNTSINGTTETKSISIYVPVKTATVEGKILVAGIIIIFLIPLVFLVLSLMKMSFLKKCSPYLVAEGDTITSIASACNVNWKKLAKVNKLKAPYTIKPGQEIFAPPVPPQPKE